MPVLVSHPDHTDCEVCAHSALAGLGTTAPKTPEEHLRTCCSPEAIEGRKDLEDRAREALETGLEWAEEAAQRYRDSLAREAARKDKDTRPNPDWEASLEAARTASEERRREAAKPVNRLRFEVREIKARIARRLSPPTPPRQYAVGSTEAAWLGGEDPTVTDLFTGSEVQQPPLTRTQRLRARFRR